MNWIFNMPKKITKNSRKREFRTFMFMLQQQKVKANAEKTLRRKDEEHKYYLQPKHLSYLSYAGIPNEKLLFLRFAKADKGEQQEDWQKQKQQILISKLTRVVVKPLWTGEQRTITWLKINYWPSELSPRAWPLKTLQNKNTISMITLRAGPVGYSPPLKSSIRIHQRN